MGSYKKTASCQVPQIVVIMYTVSAVVRRPRQKPGLAEFSTTSSRAAEESNEYQDVFEERIVFKPVEKKNISWSRGVEEEPVGISVECMNTINFVHNRWISVKEELERGSEEVLYYQENPNPQLANFSPLNLEAWMANKIYQNIISVL